MVTESDSPQSSHDLGPQQSPVGLRLAAPSSKPSRTLPTNRIAFPKQLEILRAFEAASGPARKPVSLTQVAGLAKLAAQTLSLANPFFLDVGLTRKVEGGFLPSDAVHEYALAFQWNPETAAHKLAPPFFDHWAWNALRPSLQMSRELSERDALSVLSSASNAAPDYRPNLLLLLSYLDAAGLVEYDGTAVRGRTNQPLQASWPEALDPADARPKQSSPGQSPTVVSSSFAQHPEGRVQFVVSVSVDMSEFGSWRADRIAAFFSGIAKVLAAKADVEGESAIQ